MTHRSENCGIDTPRRADLLRGGAQSALGLAPGAAPRHACQSGEVAARSPCPQMRIAYFSSHSDAPREGNATALDRLAAYAQFRGHAIRVYAPSIGWQAPPIAKDLVAVPSLPVPMSPGWRFAPGLPGAAMPDLRRFAPSIVHVSAPDPFGAAAIGMGRALGIPVVASLHARFETRLSYHRLGFLRRPLLAWLRRFYGRCDLVLVPSSEVARELASLGIGATRIWGRGVDPVQFNPARRDRTWRRAIGIADHEVALLFLGPLTSEKGVDMFRSVVRSLHAHRLPIRALVIGNGPRRDLLEREMPGAIFTGRLDGDELGRAVASADILLNTSLTDAFGSATLEAMASGVPVVAADAPASRALIVDGVSGILAPAHSVPAYVDAIRDLIGQADRRWAMAHAGAVRARLFDWPGTLDGALDAYAEVVREGRGVSLHGT